MEETGSKQLQLTERQSIFKKQEKMIPVLVGIWVFGFCLYFIMVSLEPALLKNPHLFDYGTLITKGADNMFYRFLWIIGDWTEAPAYKSLISSIFFVVAGFVVHYICRTRPDAHIYPVTSPQDQGVFVWFFISSFIGIIIPGYLYGGSMAELGWIPTFLPCCTIPAALILQYGGGWNITLTAGILTGLIMYPFSRVGQIVAGILSVPGLTCYTIFSIGIAGIVITEIFRILPWSRGFVTGEKKPKFEPYNMTNIPKNEPTGSWLMRRTLADFTELSFFGSEITGVALILGAIISWAMNPAHAAYGAPYLLIAIISGQFLTSSLALFIWYEKYEKNGFYPTFGANVGVAVILLLFAMTGVEHATSIQTVVATAILCAFIVPPANNIGGSFMAKNCKRYVGLIGAAPTMGIGIGIVSYIVRGLMALGII